MSKIAVIFDDEFPELELRLQAIALKAAQRGDTLLVNGLSESLELVRDACVNAGANYTYAAALAASSRHFKLKPEIDVDLINAADHVIILAQDGDHWMDALHRVATASGKTVTRRRNPDDGVAVAEDNQVLAPVV